MRTYSMNVGEAGAVTGHIHLIAGVIASLIGMLVVSFVLAVLLSQTTTNADGTVTSNVFPSGIEGIVSLYVELTLPPTALFVFFIGGFLAPRSSYLVGATLGLLDGILWSLLFVISPAAQPTAE